MRPIVVFDTNILISALLSLRGSPFHSLALARTNVVESVTCEAILEEFKEKYARSGDGGLKLPLCSDTAWGQNKASLHSEPWHKQAGIIRKLPILTA